MSNKKQTEQDVFFRLRKDLQRFIKYRNESKKKIWEGIKRYIKEQEEYDKEQEDLKKDNNEENK